MYVCVCACSYTQTYIHIAACFRQKHCRKGCICVIKTAKGKPPKAECILDPCLSVRSRFYEVVLNFNTCVPYKEFSHESPLALS